MILVAACLALAGAAWAADGACGDDDVPCWLALLGNGDGAPALRAAMHLGEVGAVEAVDSLIAKFASSDLYMATAAVHAVVKIGNPSVLPLVKATKHEKASVRKFAAYALGRIGGEDAFAAVKLAAVDSDAKVRIQAATAFGLMKDDRALVPLFGLLRDHSISVRTAAAEALGSLADRRASQHLIEYGLADLSPEVARASTQALKKIGPEAIEALIDKYNTKPVYVRKRILVTVANIGADAGGPTRERAIKLASWVLARSNEGTEARTVAAYVVGNLEAKDAAPVLKKVLEDTKDVESMASLNAACRVALDKIYQKHGMKTDY